MTLGNIPSSPNSEISKNWVPRDTQLLLSILFLALILRLMFFTGFYGSDEVTYFEVAQKISNGNWPQTDYIGAIRYGVNIPTAIFLKIFGISEFSANLWSLLASIGEVTLVYIAAKHTWGTRPALIAALCLAILPIHVHYAGRMMADAPLAFFVSLCFISTWIAEKRNSVALYLLAGFAAGTIFWIKDAVFYLTVAVLSLYVLFFRRWHTRWLYMALGVFLVLGINYFLMWKIHGDPLYIHVIGKKSLQNLPLISDTSPTFYLSYLLLNLKHSLLLFYLALGAVFLIFKCYTFRQVWRRPEGYVLIWAFGFIGILSLLSLRQTNYILIFVAPLSLLSGYFISDLKHQMQLAIMGTLIASGVIFSAFQQQAAQSFTANSRASVSFAEQHPHTVIFASTGAIRATTYRKILGGSNNSQLPVLSLSKLDVLLRTNAKPSSIPELDFAHVKKAYAVMDPQTFGWGAPDDSRWDERVSSPCLIRIAELAPAPMGFGRHIVKGIVNFVTLLPKELATKINSKLLSSFSPQSATVFQVVPPCFVSGD